MENRIDPGMNWTLSIIRGNAGPDAYGDELGSSVLEGLDLGEETWAWLASHGCGQPDDARWDDLTWVLVNLPGERVPELTNLVAQRGLSIDMPSLAQAHDR